MSLRGIKTAQSSIYKMGNDGLNSILPTNPKMRILLFVIFAIFIGISFYLTYNYFVNKNKISYKENINNFTNSAGKDVEILRFSTTWCPHCTSSKPEWVKLKTENEGKLINGYSVIFTDVDCTQESPEVEKMMNQYKIEGFPTIKLLKDNKVYDFDAKPTKENLNNFINTLVV